MVFCLRNQEFHKNISYKQKRPKHIVLGLLLSARRH